MERDDRKKEDKDCILFVSITGKNIQFEFPINNTSDFNDLENILKILKRKLE